MSEFSVQSELQIWCCCCQRTKSVGVVATMVNARSVLDERIVLTETAFVELVVWEVPSPVRASEHLFKYRLALISDGQCIIR